MGGGAAEGCAGEGRAAGLRGAHAGVHLATQAAIFGGSTESLLGRAIEWHELRDDVSCPFAVAFPARCAAASVRSAARNSRTVRVAADGARFPWEREGARRGAGGEGWGGSRERVMSGRKALLADVTPFLALGSDATLIHSAAVRI